MKEMEELKYLVEENRRNTFKNWVFTNTKACNADKMAEAGFIFMESPDTVKCFLCNKVLDGWTESDDPWIEHQEHSTKCSFARLHKSEETITLREYLEIKNELVNILIDRNFGEMKKMVEESFIKA